MKKLNDQCTAIFAAFLDQLGNSNSVVLKATNAPHLFLDLHQDSFPTPEGSAKVYLLAQTDPEDNERKVPEMLFIVIDNRQSPTDLDNLIIWPQRYVHDRIGLYIESIIIREEDVLVPLPMLYDATLFYSQAWLPELGSFGYHQ